MTATARRLTGTNLERYRRSMSEAQMEHAIGDLVALRGGRMFHLRRSDLAPEMADFPDLVIVLPDRGYVVFAELKSMRRVITPGQLEVMQMLADCNKCESFTVRPEPKHETETSYDALIDWLRRG